VLGVIIDCYVLVPQRRLHRVMKELAQIRHGNQRARMNCILHRSAPRSLTTELPALRIHTVVLLTKFRLPHSRRRPLFPILKRALRFHARLAHVHMGIREVGQGIRTGSRGWGVLLEQEE
jgi:hypothetical protein